MGQHERTAGVAFALAAAAMLPMTSFAEGDPQAIRIGVVGDQTMALDLNSAYGILEQGVSALASRKVRVILHLGDLVESTSPENDVRASFAHAAAILDRFPGGWFMAAGDHDVVPTAFKLDSSDRSRERLFQDLYSARVPVAAERLFYSFDVDGYHFVALYATEALHADPRWGDIFLAKLSSRQLEWLGGDLEAHRGAKGIVVFVHKPLWYNWSAWRDVHEVLRRYAVAAVVAGHFHYAQDDGVMDGIRYLTIGATGGTVKRGNADAGNAQMVGVLTVSGRSADLEIVPLNAQPPLKLAPRIDMDRVQALDVMLNDLEYLTTTVGWRAGAIVKSCTDERPAHHTIAAIGNPIDLPITIRIEPVAAGGVAYGRSAFQGSDCVATPSDSSCVLPGGSRMWFSNYAGVKVDEYAGPLWEAEIAGIAGSEPARQTQVEVQVSFTSEGRTYRLERRTRLTVVTCP